MGLLDRWATAAASPAGPLVGPPPALASPWADTDALTAVTLAGLYDQLDAIPATRSQAVALPAVARGRDLIAVSVARMSLDAVNAAGRLDIQPRIVARPEVGRARFVTLLWTVDSLIFYGVAVWLVVERYAEDGRPRVVRYVPPGSVKFDTAGNVTSCFGVDVKRYDDVIRFDGPHEGILARANETIRTTRKLLADYAKAANTPNPDVELHQTGGEALTEPQIDAMISRWASARAGANGRVAFTNQSIEAKLHGQQPENLLVEARKAADLDLARHMGLPAWAVDAEVGGSSLTYSNVPSRSRELIDYTLAGYMEAITGRLSLDDILAAGTWSRFSTDALTDGDFASRMTAGKTAVEAGIYTAAELRAREAGQPIEGVPAP